MPLSDTDPDFELDWNDPRRGQLTVRRACDGGYVAWGLGDGARVLSDAFENRCPTTEFFNTCNDISKKIREGSLSVAQQCGLPKSLAKISDGPLRSIVIAGVLLKAGYNPDEPRDERGRWTSDGNDGENQNANEPHDIAYHGDYHNFLVQYYA